MDKQVEMVRIVYNAEHGGFGLSEKAQKRIWEIRGQPMPENWWDSDIHREDPALLQVIDEMGLDEVSGHHAELAITELPRGTKYIVHEYDGMEEIWTMDNMFWNIAGEEPVWPNIELEWDNG